RPADRRAYRTHPRSAIADVLGAAEGRRMNATGCTQQHRRALDQSQTHAQGPTVPLTQNLGTDCLFNTVGPLDPPCASGTDLGPVWDQVGPAAPPTTDGDLFSSAHDSAAGDVEAL